MGQGKYSASYTTSFLRKSQPYLKEKEMFSLSRIRRKKVVVVVAVFMLLSIVKPSVAFAPALALLNPAVLGSVVVAGGVLAGAGAHYAPAVYSSGQSAVNSFGTFQRTLYQAQKFALSSGVEYVVGRAEELSATIGSAGSALYDWITGNSAEVPILAGALSDASTTPEAVPGSVVETTTGVVALLEQLAGYPAIQFTAYVENECNLAPTPSPWIQGPTTVSRWVQMPHPTPGFYFCATDIWTYEATSFPPDAGVFDAVAFGTAVGALDQATVAPEIDKLIAGQPSAWSGSSPWTTTETNNALAIVNSEITTTALADAETALLADPTNTALQIALANAQTQADLASAVASPAVEVPAEEIVTATVPGFTDVVFPEVPEIPPFEFFAPIQTAYDDMLTNMLAHEPFGTFASLGGYLDDMTATPVAPVLDLTLPYIGSFEVDLAPFDPLATFMRGTIGFLVLVGSAFFAIKIWV